MTLRGWFIVVDGADGTGKSTAMRRLADHIRSKGREVVETREPGGTPFAEKLRALVFDPENPIDSLSQMLIMNVARRAHLRDVIRPAVSRGAVVLCDRFVASTLCLQTSSQEGGTTVTEAQVLQAHREYCYDAKPDLSLHLHAPDEVRAERRRLRAGSTDRFERSDEAYHAEVARKYRDAGHRLGFRTVDVDAGGTPETTLAKMIHAVDPLATDSATAILQYVPRPCGGGWLPVRDDQGTIWWSSSPLDAHHRASALQRREPGLQTRFVPVSIADHAQHVGGLHSLDVDLLVHRHRSAA